MILDCLNRSLKGLSINLRGDVDILLFPLSNVSQVMYPCNSPEYRQKINTKLPCLYSPTLYIADFIFQFFKMVKAKSAIIWKILNLISYFPFQFHLIHLHWEKKCGSWREFWLSQLCKTVPKQCFCCHFFSTGGEAIWSCVITW